MDKSNPIEATPNPSEPTESMQPPSSGNPWDNIEVVEMEIGPEGPIGFALPASSVSFEDSPENPE